MLLTNEDFHSLYMYALQSLPEQDFALKFKGNVSPDDYKPGLRLSGLGKCARQQVLKVLYPEDTDTIGSPWQNIMGYAGQEILTLVMQKMGYQFSSGEKAVSFAGVPGHIDGKLTGLDLGSLTAIWDSKIRAAYAFARLVKGEIDPEMWAQMYGYISAENTDYAIITAAPFDISAARNSLRISKVEAPPEICRLVLPADKAVTEQLETRVDMLKLAIECQIIPKAEFNPLSKAHATFPCGYCPWQARCITIGETNSYVVTPLPEEWPSPVGASELLTS